MISITPFQILAAFGLDLLLGDPRWLPHPVRWMGKWILCLERRLHRARATARLQKLLGVLLVTGTLAAVLLACFGVWYVCLWLHPALWTGITTYLAFTTLSARSLDREVGRVVDCCHRGDLEQARGALSMIVGRDTEKLSEAEILRAAFETLSENLSDGVIAPLLYLALGGVPLALAYKAVNTLDSMVGYKSPRYVNFGWAAARLDDLANLLPARLTALLMIASSAALGFCWRTAWQAVRHDAHRQPSPNSGYPEAALAGALGIQLGGVNYYAGVPSLKPTLGTGRVPMTVDVYPQARMVFYLSSLLMLLLAVLFHQ
ncbi:MAG: adenosylcobinamide-phosphate synthase CbiB [Acidobacteria bacterium]|nr:adenosylcobinamide-phosphate synthase CbiB [Acidobacteriota bacterium]MCI0725094.1 adenosylcobinamide-phosphate synthase CbiB [Acidobacteriota bacterium]